MRKVLISIRTPRSLWQLFHIRLLREGVSVQRWVEGTVRRAIKDRDVLKADLDESSPYWRIATKKNTPVKQVVARLDGADLGRLRRKLAHVKLPLGAWLSGEIVAYVESQPVDATAMLSSRVLAMVRDCLPPAKQASSAVVRALLNWPDEILEKAFSERSYGLREATRKGYVDLVVDILDLASTAVELEKRVQELKAKWRERLRRKGGVAF